jgi:hypothetical protein
VLPTTPQQISSAFVASNAVCGADDSGSVGTLIVGSCIPDKMELLVSWADQLDALGARMHVHAAWQGA